MPVFALDPEVVTMFPEAQIRFVVARGLHNGEPWPEVAERHRRLVRQISDGAWRPPDEDDPPVASWHAAYRSFGTNPRRFRPSLDALCRRLHKSGRLPEINGAVDAYNLVSVTHGTPAGAFDLDRLDAYVSIRPARDGDAFVPLGEPDKVEHPTPGEVVYAQGSQVLTRHWNHRDADATKVTEETSNAVFILERVAREVVSNSAMADAQRALADLLRPHALIVTLAVIDAETPVTLLTEDEPGMTIRGPH